MTTQSIFISGANQGLGFETASHLLSKPNTLVFLGSRNVQSGEEAIKKIQIDKSSSVVLVQLDVTNQSSVDKAAEKVKEVLKDKKLEGLNALVNNAGTVEGSFQQVFAVNVFGPAALYSALRPILANDANVVNVSSVLGSMAAYAPGKKFFSYPEYGSSKSALNGLTAMWAYTEREKGTNIRIVSICPGYNATNINGYGALGPGAQDPKDGAKIIVDAALATEGESGIFYNAQGPIEW